MKQENDSLRNILIGLGISKIYIDNKLSIQDLVNSICISSTEDNLSLEIEKLKKIIEENSVIKKEQKEITKKTNFSNKIVAITGNYGSGKSLVTAMLAKAADKNKLKVIIFDFDIFNSSINTLFKIPKYNKIISSEEECIQKINSHIDIFCGIDLLFNEKNKINYEKVKKLFENFKNNYDLILVDTSSEINLKYIKAVLANVDKIIFLLEPNLLEIKKSKNLLEIYLEDWEIPNYKFLIIMNKVNINSIDEEIIKNLFSKLKVIEKIKFSTLYTLLANDVYAKIPNLGKYENILNQI